MRSVTLLLLTLSCSSSPDEDTSPPPQDEVAIDGGTTSTDETAEPDEVCPYSTDTIVLASSNTIEFDLTGFDRFQPMTQGAAYWYRTGLSPELLFTLRGTEAEQAHTATSESLSDLGFNTIHYYVSIEADRLWEGAFVNDMRHRFTYAGAYIGPQAPAISGTVMPVADMPDWFTLADDTWCTYPVMVTFSWQDEHRPACHGEAVYEVMMQPVQGQVCPYVTPEPSEPVIVVPGGDTADIPP